MDKRSCCGCDRNKTSLKKQGKYYSDKKRRHTLKVQLITDKKTKNILRIAFAKGKIHDFRMFKENKMMLHEDICILADKAYKGIHKIHFMSLISIKASKNHPLMDIEHAFNTSPARERIFIEHINRYLKRFRILSSRHTNKHRKFVLRVSLLCAIYNLKYNQYFFMIEGFGTDLVINILKKSIL
ncbi:MAG: transposase family protein [Ruminococcus sp.]|nr:transposase family protein [Ruminococcus sp.]